MVLVIVLIFIYINSRIGNPIIYIRDTLPLICMDFIPSTIYMLTKYNSPSDYEKIITLF